MGGRDWPDGGCGCVCYVTAVVQVSVQCGGAGRGELPPLPCPDMYRDITAAGIANGPLVFNPVFATLLPILFGECVSSFN